MKTQALAPQPKSDMMAPMNILAPAASQERTIEPSTESMAARLARHPFLAEMNQRHLALLGDCAEAVQFQKGQVIFREGDCADRFYLIETGKVNLASSGGLGEPMLGWSWMFPPHTWTFAARAAEPTTAIFFDGATLREHCENDPSFGYELLKRLNLVMYQRMQATRNKIPAINHRQPIVLGRAAAVAYGGGGHSLEPECPQTSSRL